MSFFFKNPQSYFSYFTQIWHFSILPNGEIFNFFIKFWRTCDTSIKMFCEMAKKPQNQTEYSLSFHLCAILPLVNADMFEFNVINNAHEWSGWFQFLQLFSSRIISALWEWFQLLLNDRECQQFARDWIYGLINHYNEWNQCEWLIDYEWSEWF